MKLTPCKECGKYNRRLVYDNSSGKTTYRVACPSCGYSTKEANTMPEAINFWNHS